MTKTPNSTFALLPAVDISHGASVRLTAGKVDAHDFGPPAEVVRQFVMQGAHWLHLVDLDRARGHGNNDEVLATAVLAAREASTSESAPAGSSELAKESSSEADERTSSFVTDAGAIARSSLTIQLSGGIREFSDVQRAFGFGADWVNLACESLLHDDHIARAIDAYGHNISVSVDVRGQQVIARGTNRDCGTLDEALIRLSRVGVRRLVVTDVDADGAMAGPNFDLLSQVCDAGFAVVASGGVASIADLQRLHSLMGQGVVGAIVGKALYAGAFTFSAASAAIS
jgi:phosphoribosylformimino-5-aminoimidazole carboxamide ribonucleotide (ProFAR) isomerase